MQLTGGSANTTISLNPTSFHFGSHLAVAPPTAGSDLPTFGRPTFDSLEITATLGDATHDLFVALTRARFWGTATLTQTNADGNPAAVWVLSNVFVTDDNLSADNGETTQHAYSFVFTAITETTNSAQASYNLITGTPGTPQGPAPSSLAPLRPATPAITVTAPSFTYDGTAHPASASAAGTSGASVGGTFSFAYYTGNTPGGTGSPTAPTPAGDYVVIAHFASTDKNFRSVDSSPQAFTIRQASASIMVTAYTAATTIYDGQPHTAAGAATGVGNVNLSAGLNLVGTTHVQAGSYPGDVWSFHDPSGNYADASGTVDDGIARATPAFSQLSASQAIAAGTASITLSGRLTGNTAAVPPGSVTASIAGMTLSAPVSAVDGSFSISFNTVAIPAAATPYAITYAYSASANGTTNFNDATPDSSTTLAVRPVPVAGISGPSQGLAGQVLTFILSAGETFAPADTIYHFDINWGDGATAIDAVDPTTATHVYAQPGTYQVSVNATDSSGTSSPGATTTVVVQAFTSGNLQSAIDSGTVVLQPSPSLPLSSILASLAALGTQDGTANVIVSLPNPAGSSSSPSLAASLHAAPSASGSTSYPSITASLPVGLNFTLEGNGATVLGNVTVSQPGGATSLVRDLNVSGNLKFQIGNTARGSARASHVDIGGDAAFQAGNGASDSIVVTALSVAGMTQMQTGNGQQDAIAIDGLVAHGDLVIQTGNGQGDSVAITAVSGPTVILGSTQIQLGNGAGDTATINGSAAGTMFNGPLVLQMGNGGDTVNISTVDGRVNFGATVQVKLGNGSNTLNLAATKAGVVRFSQVSFKQSAVFSAGNGKNTKYQGTSSQITGSPTFKNI